jgi:DNA-directed RNA polymerase specialized sigma24 family protein
VQLSGVPDITESMRQDDSQHSAARRFGLLFDAHRRTMLAYVLRRVDDREDAADAVAETFLIAWRRLEDVPRGDGARPWLLGVARRVLANQRRGVRRHVGLADRLGRELATQLAIVNEASETDLLVRRALATLSENDRELSLEEYRRVLDSLKAVGVDDWLAAMPPSVVLPAGTDQAIDAMLAGIPLLEGFDKSALERHTVVRDRYQLGARVTGAVACGWIEQWVTARRTGDDAASAAAVEAMQSSRRWPILREMQTEGDYPKVLWAFADAIKRNTAIPAGKTTTVEQGYRSALGC